MEESGRTQNRVEQCRKEWKRKECEEKWTGREKVEQNRADCTRRVQNGIYQGETQSTRKEENSKV